MTSLAIANPPLAERRVLTPRPAPMNSPKQRVALYFVHPVALEAYRLLVETVSAARVVVRAGHLECAARAVTVAGVDLALVDACLVSHLSPDWVDEMATPKGCQLVVVGTAGEVATADRSVASIQEPWQLTLLLEGRDWTQRPTRTDLPQLETLKVTVRERQVWRLIATGATVRGIARQLGLAESTVDSHKSRLMRKLGVHKSVELVRLAVRLGLVDA